MKQVARRLRDGRLELLDVPEPEPVSGTAGVRLAASVVSAGTERATLEVARKGLLGKARARPDQARQVFEEVKRSGVRATWQVVKQRLDELGPLGYSAAGTVEEVGPGCRDLAPGDRVAIAGGRFAAHAELDVVPSLMCAPVPSEVGFEDAAFATLGSIALNGFRLGEAEVGGTVAVIGLGVVGQLAVQIARSAGCTVLATDLDPELVAMAAELPGVEAVERGRLDRQHPWDATADAVLICAATSSDDPVLLASSLCRDRGIMVVVGDVGLELPRARFYEKELQLRLARSYGPGRHDPNYELHGHDYPLGYARWTIQRNMGTFLDLVAVGSIRPSELITHRFPFAQAEEAFAALEGDGPVVGVVLDYPAAERARADREAASTEREASKKDREPGPAAAAPRSPASGARGRPRFGLVGAGGFATRALIPGLKQAGLAPVAVASAAGLSAEGARRQFDFERADASAEAVIGSDDLDLIAIATRHDTHSQLASRALRRGLATYVEKPLAIDDQGLRQVRAALADSTAPLFVGFNRRFAPLTLALAEAFEGSRTIQIGVNAGRLQDHWLDDPQLGGGRLLGEGCHFIDLLLQLVDSDPRSVLAHGYPSIPGLARSCVDNFVLSIDFEDGSVGSLRYSADAPTGPGKERIEVSGSAGYAVVDDFSSGALWGPSRKRKLERGGNQDKGFGGQYEMIAAVLAGEVEAPSPDSYLLTTLTALAAVRSLHTGVPEPVFECPGADRDEP